MSFLKRYFEVPQMPYVKYFHSSAMHTYRNALRQTYLAAHLRHLSGLYGLYAFSLDYLLKTSILSWRF